MLVLSRKIDERIVIGEAGEIVITICNMNSERVRVGIEAPEDVPVHREEVFLNVQRNKEAETDRPPE